MEGNIYVHTGDPISFRENHNVYYGKIPDYPNIFHLASVLCKNDFLLLLRMNVDYAIFAKKKTTQASSNSLQ